MSYSWEPHRTYAPDHAEARFLDPLLGDYVEVTVQLAADEIFILDGTGRSQKRWRYTELRHAFEKSQDQERVLTSASERDSHLVINNDGLYAALRSRAPQLRNDTPGELWRVWSGLPPRIQVGLIVLVGAALVFAYRYVAALFA